MKDKGFQLRSLEFAHSSDNFINFIITTKTLQCPYYCTTSLRVLDMNLVQTPHLAISSEGLTFDPNLCKQWWIVQVAGTITENIDLTKLIT